MCGIAGVLDFARSHSQVALLDLAAAMGDGIRHRGPDESGEWADAEAGIAIAHRRLSIQDLSAAGRQPMHSASGRYVIAYNGELYNAGHLRKQLEVQGAAFKGHSDTEVLVEAMARWGVEKTLPKLVGMFAFALWDQQERTLILARDRLGIKPLYWGRQGEKVYFTSELKSLFAHPDFVPEIDRLALSDLVAFNFVPGPHSIFKGFSHLQPGTYVRLDVMGQDRRVRYWDLGDVVAKGQKAGAQISDEEAISSLDDLLGQAVRGRMIADVPVGSFLSGGVDSTAVTALMQAASDSPVKTFTIGFSEGQFNEAEHARAIATHLGTDHHELYVSSQDALDVIPKLATMYCEPFADSSQIPTYLISAMARNHVTVALSGDGGDETFAGYNRYLAGQNLWPRFRGIPAPARTGMAKMLQCVPHVAYDALAAFVPARHRPSQFGDKMNKFAGMLACQDLDQFHAQVVRFWDDVSAVVVDGGDSTSWHERANAVQGIGDPVVRMQGLDMLFYLPGDILTKMDRASMAVGLEARVPLLDHRLVEFMSGLPMHHKIRNGETKWLLRRVLDKYVPRDLIDRPKMGFAVPLGDWLRGPLRAWAEDLLSESALRDAGLFHPSPVREKWRRHLAGQRHEHYALWSILMAQAWHRTWMVR